MAYLDHAATTAPRPGALDAIAAALRDTWANPSGGHGPARAARTVLDDARDTVAALVGAEPTQVVFTSGGTEADNLAVLGVHDRVGGTLVCSAIEHHAVLDPVTARGGHTVGVGADGIVHPDALADVLAGLDDVSLVSIMAVNNEVGTVQPVAELIEVVRRRAPDALVHIDAVQAPAWFDVAPVVANADLVSVSAHKIGGPKGIGALVVRPRARPMLAPRQVGGSQETEVRPGTQNVSGAAGFGAAIDGLLIGRDTEVATVARLAARLVAGLHDVVDDIVMTVDRVTTPVVPGIVHVCIPGVRSESLLYLLDRAGVAASAASSCASGAMASSHVLTAMGVDPVLAGGSLRLSLGWSSTDADIDDALDALGAAVTQLRATQVAGR